MHAGERINAHQLFFGAFRHVGAEARHVLNVDYDSWRVSPVIPWHLRLADPGPHQDTGRGARRQTHVHFGRDATIRRKLAHGGDGRAHWTPPRS